MLFVGFFYPLFKSLGDLWIIVIGIDDGIKESSFQSKFELFYDSMFSEGEVAKTCELFELSDVLVKAFPLFKTS